MIPKVALGPLIIVWFKYGVFPNAMMAFSIARSMFLSHGWIRIVLASGTVTLAAPDTGTCEPK